MSKTLVNILLSILLLVPVQAIIFNNLILFNGEVPLVFIYVIISLPVTLGTNISLTLAFITGLAVDIFGDTQGVNALACTLLAFARKPVYHLYMSFDDDLAGMRPSLRTMGYAPYMKYLLTMTLLYCFMVFAIEAFQFHNFSLMLLRIVCSTIFTFVIIYAIDSLSIRQRQREKKL